MRRKTIEFYRKWEWGCEITRASVTSVPFFFFPFFFTTWAENCEWVSVCVCECVNFCPQLKQWTSETLTLLCPLPLTHEQLMQQWLLAAVKLCLISGKLQMKYWCVVAKDGNREWKREGGLVSMSPPYLPSAGIRSCGRATWNYATCWPTAPRSGRSTSRRWHRERWVKENKTAFDMYFFVSFLTLIIYQ